LRIHLSALGCRLNEAELEQWAAAFKAAEGDELAELGLDLVIPNANKDNLVSLTQAEFQDTAMPQSHTDIARIRFASVEPWDLSDGFLDLFSNPRVQPHMHLPLQSGSDTVLRRMARRCKTAEFARLTASLRSVLPGFNITTDIIAGFPGETDAEWRESLDFIATQHSL